MCGPYQQSLMRIGLALRAALRVWGILGTYVLVGGWGGLSPSLWGPLVLTWAFWPPGDCCLLWYCGVCVVRG